jgi:hypothetical protein
MSDLTLEQSLKEYGKFVDVINKYLSPTRAEQVKSFFGKREITLSSSPYNLVLGAPGAYAGGYITTVNKIIHCAVVLERVWENFSTEKYHTTEELVFSAIFSEVAKIGTNDQPYYLPNKNEWEIKNRGIIYAHNPYHYNMKYSDKALFILQQEKIDVSENEYLAIKLYNAMCDEENNHYFHWDTKMKSNIALILNQARTVIVNSK